MSHHTPASPTFSRSTKKKRSLGVPSQAVSHSSDEEDSYDSQEYGSDSSLDISSDSDSESYSEEIERKLTKKNDHSGSPSRTSRRNTKQNENPNELKHEERPKSGLDAETSRQNRYLSYWSRTAILVVLAVVVASFSMLRGGYVSEQCGNSISGSAQALMAELNEFGKFPPSFDAREFIALFNHRIIGRPTVIHLVTTSEPLARRPIDWLKQKQTCSGSLTIPASHGDFITKSSSFAIHNAGKHMETGACRVFFTVLLKNSHFEKTNRDWLESVIDDTTPFAYTAKGKVDTSDWCVILLDLWTSEMVETLSNSNPSDIQQKIRDVTTPLWTARFYQRIQGILFL